MARARCEFIVRLSVNSHFGTKPGGVYLVVVSSARTHTPERREKSKHSRCFILIIKKCSGDDFQMQK